MRYYAADTPGGDTYAAAIEHGLTPERFAARVAIILEGTPEEDATPHEVTLHEFRTAGEFATWIAGDGNNLPAGETWATIGARTHYGDVVYEFPGAYRFRPPGFVQVRPAGLEPPASVVLDEMRDAYSIDDPKHPDWGSAA